MDAGGSRLSALAGKSLPTVECLSYKKEDRPALRRKPLVPDAVRTSYSAPVTVPGIELLETNIDAPDSPPARDSLHDVKKSPRGSTANLHPPSPNLPQKGGEVLSSRGSTGAPSPRASVSPVGSPKADSDVGQGVKTRRRRTDVYEDALPFRKDSNPGKGEREEEGPEGSSDENDDEPIYYNLLLLRQKTLNHANTLLHSKVSEKDKFDRQVRKLSMRYGSASQTAAAKRAPNGK